MVLWSNWHLCCLDIGSCVPWSAAVVGPLGCQQQLGPLAHTSQVNHHSSLVETGWQQVAGPCRNIQAEGPLTYSDIWSCASHDRARIRKEERPRNVLLCKQAKLSPFPCLPSPFSTASRHQVSSTGLSWSPSLASALHVFCLSPCVCSSWHHFANQPESVEVARNCSIPPGGFWCVSLSCVPTKWAQVCNVRQSNTWV